MIRKLPLFALAAVLLAGPGDARAGVVFSNFGPGDGYQLRSGDLIGPDPFGVTVVPASKFTAGGGGALTTIELALGTVVGSGAVTVELHANGPGDTLGALLATGSTTATGPFFSNNPPASASMSAATLVSGDMYWVVVKSSAGGLLAWNLNSIGDIGPQARSDNGGATFGYTDDTHGAFRVTTADVAAVPEPSSLALLAAGGGSLAVGWLRRRGRRG